MYTYLVDGVEGLAVARVDPRLDSEQTARTAVEAIRALDQASYRGAGPRILVVEFDDAASFFGAKERERIFAANRDTQHTTVRLLVASSSLWVATLQVIKMRVESTAHSRLHTFLTVQQAQAFAESLRPGVGTLLEQLGRQLAGGPASGVQRRISATAPAAPARAHRQKLA